MAARPSATRKDVGVVGAKGFDPARPTPRIVLAAPTAHLGAFLGIEGVHRPLTAVALSWASYVPAPASRSSRRAQIFPMAISASSCALIWSSAALEEWISMASDCPPRSTHTYVVGTSEFSSLTR